MKNKILVVVIFVFISICGIAQIDTTATSTSATATASPDTSEVLTYSEIMPQYPGGTEAFNKFLIANIKYPKAERQAGKQGTVYVQFIVEKDGSISDIHIVREVPGAPAFSTEVLRVMNLMPAWTPGSINRKPVRVEMTQPIKFTFQDRKPKKNRK